VCVVDVLLPDLSGITLSSVLRGLVEDRAIWVVALSGLGPKLLGKARERGIFDDIVCKPVQAAVL
jgi:CheY-like chemotaxis protein